MENLKPLRQSNFSTACIRPEVALLDQVEQRQAGGLVLLGDRDHQAEVGLDEGLLGLLALQDGAAQLALLGRGEALGGRRQLGLRLAAGLDGLGQADLVVLGQQRVLTDVGQIQPDQILVVSLEALLRQSLAKPSITMGLDRSRPCRAFALNWCSLRRLGAQGLPKHCTGHVKMPKQQGFVGSSLKRAFKGAAESCHICRPAGASAGPIAADRVAEPTGPAGEGPGPWPIPGPRRRRSDGGPR